MKKYFFLGLGALLIATAFENCGKGLALKNNPGASGSSSDPFKIGSTPSLPVVGNEPNVLALKVGGGYVNAPCVTVTVCAPGSSSCQTISNILLDTGSFGLRVFSSLVSSLNLPQITDSSGHSIAECQSYADGSSDWGPVTMADVELAGEKASNIPIQLINASFGALPSDCSSPDASPDTVGFNGIMGVGLFREDCGSLCADTSQPNNRVYFNCSAGSTTCDTSIAVQLSQQVVNPVATLPSDNNGVILQLPGVSSNGDLSVSGYLILGIGTKTDNTPPSGVTTFPADANGNFKTQFNGTTYNNSFIDSGSNGLFFPAISSLPSCSSSGVAPGFFCPSTLVNLNATQMGATSSSSNSISFQIMNGETAMSSSNPNMVFNNIGGAMSGDFDWGLPFFLGRTIYVGIEDRSSSLGTGPYWAY